MKRIPFLLKKDIYSWEGAIFNLFCLLYFIFISPFVQEASLRNLQGETSFFPWLGVALIVITILEIYALPKKMKYVHRAIMDHNGEVESSMMILWMFHSVLSIIILFMIFGSFGYSIGTGEGESELNGWQGVLVFATVMKELYLLFSLLGLHNSSDPLIAYKRPNTKEWLIDLILLAYACLAYTVTWEAIAANTNMDKSNIAMYIVHIIAMSIVFIIFYLPLRIPYHIEEVAQMKNKKDKWKFRISLFLTVLFVVLSM